MSQQMERAQSILERYKRVMGAGTETPWEHQAGDPWNQADRVIRNRDLDGRGYVVIRDERALGPTTYHWKEDRGDAEDFDKICLAVNTMSALVMAMERNMRLYESLGELYMIPGTIQIKAVVADNINAICDLIEPELVRVEGRK